MFMKNNILYPTQMGLQNFGILQVHVVSELGARPVENATVQIFSKENPATVLESLNTDISGKTIDIELVAPPIEYSLEPTQYQPYREYILVITAAGFQTVTIDSAQVLPYVKSIQPVRMPFLVTGNDNVRVIIIGPNILYGSYPPKTYESEVKESFEAEQETDGSLSFPTT